MNNRETKGNGETSYPTSSVHSTGGILCIKCPEENPERAQGIIPHSPRKYRREQDTS